MRHREMLAKSAAQHIPRVQKAMEKMNLKLTEVISNILGATCTAIPDAILASERDPHQLAKFRNDKCRNDEATVAVALQGNW